MRYVRLCEVKLYTFVQSSWQICQWCDSSDWYSALSVWWTRNLQSSTGSQHLLPWNINSKPITSWRSTESKTTSSEKHTHTHLLQSEMSRYCRFLRVATDLRVASVILGHSAAWSLQRPCELLHRAFQLTSVSWLLPKVHINWNRITSVFSRTRGKRMLQNAKWSHLLC